jgi:hypothetical protein
MAQKNLVLRSIETPDGSRCVDLFRRPDGTFGFEVYPRDSEDGSGWFAIGYYGGHVYESREAALAEALREEPWLAERVGPTG